MESVSGEVAAVYHRTVSSKLNSMTTDFMHDDENNETQNLGKYATQAAPLKASAIAIHGGPKIDSLPFGIWLSSR